MHWVGGRQVNELTIEWVFEGEDLGVYWRLLLNKEKF